MFNGGEIIRDVAKAAGLQAVGKIMLVAGEVHRTSGRCGCLLLPAILALCGGQTAVCIVAARVFLGL